VGLIKYKLRKALGAFFLWVDLNINHDILEPIVELLHPYSYGLWKNTCYRFCAFVCDHFEDFDD
jgi:hypothetical protein